MFLGECDRIIEDYITIMSKDGNLEKDINLDRFDDGGVSMREMKIGLWLAERRQLIIKLIIIFLIAISAFFFVFSTYQYVQYFLAGDPSDQFDANLGVMSPRKVTEDLVVGSLQSFPSGEKTDLAVLVTNPNPKFAANFNYCFRAAEADLECGAGYVMPGEEKYVLSLGRPGAGEGVFFEITEVYWRRIDPRQFGEWSDYAAKRLDLRVSDLEFSPAARSGLSEKVALNSLNFTITNNTPYGYYQAPISILFYSGTRLAGVNRYLVENFRPGEKRTVNLSWPGDLASVTKTEIKPDINILDDSIYLPYRGESGD